MPNHRNRAGTIQISLTGTGEDTGINAASGFLQDLFGDRVHLPLGYARGWR